MVQPRVDRSTQGTMTRLLLVRHGESGWNRTRRLTGCLDSGLNRRGRLQTEALRVRLKGIGFTALCASPLGRAAETAQIIADGLDLCVEIYDDLREIDYGDWQGQPLVKIAKCYRDWLKSPLRRTPPGGETLRGFVKRVGRVLDTIAPKGGTIGIVTHGGVVRASICHYFGFPLAKIWSMEVTNASITEIGLRNNSPLLCRFNDAAHISSSYSSLASISM